MDEEMCIQHAEALRNMEQRIELIEKEVHEIHGALMGTFKETGYISRTNNRLCELEQFKTAMIRLVWIFATSFIGLALTLIVTVIVKTL